MRASGGTRRHEPQVGQTTLTSKPLSGSIVKDLSGFCGSVGDALATLATFSDSGLCREFSLVKLGVFEFATFATSFSLLISDTAPASKMSDNFRTVVSLSLSLLIVRSPVSQMSLIGSVSEKPNVCVGFSRSISDNEHCRELSQMSLIWSGFGGSGCQRDATCSGVGRVGVRALRSPTGFHS
ncbi:MAG: hypothetical protein LASZOEIN_001771 [Candidatus Fervidibacter sp.]